MEERTLDQRSPVLVGIDYSDQSRRAVQFAARLVGRLGAPLTVVNVRPDPQVLPARMAAEAPLLREQSIISATRLLRSVIDPLLRDLGVRGPIELRTRVEFGDPVERLVRLADELDAAFIVVGAAGRGRASTVFLGSVSQGIAARTSRPTIVVPPNAEFTDAGAQAGGNRALVCGIDGSRQSFDAAEAAAALASALGLRLLLVHALPEELPPDDPSSELDSLLEVEARPQLERLRRTAAKIEQARRSLVLAAGEPAAALDEVAASEDAELIAVGTRGHGSLKALMIGSVSRRLAATARRPVMVVNPRRDGSPKSTPTPFAAVRRHAAST